MTTPPPTDWRALCEELVDAYAWCVDNYMTGSAEKDSLVQRARAALAQPEPEQLTVQECNDMRKHGENYIFESRDGKEIQLDGYFTREDLIELANTQPTTH
jgi:hypothetical protein